MSNNATYETPVIQQAQTLGSAVTVFPKSLFVCALMLYNSHSADIDITIKDGNGIIACVRTIPAGQSVWIDWASMTGPFNGKGFFFQGKLVILAATADKVNCFLSGLTDF